MPSKAMTFLLCLSFLLLCCAGYGVAQGEGQAQEGVLIRPLVSSVPADCKVTIDKAIFLNERFKKSVGFDSSQKQSELRLEAETYADEVLLKQLPSCVTYAATHSDIALGVQVFDLAYSYKNSASEGIGLALAKLFSENQTMTKAILFGYEKSKRNILIDTLMFGLDNLFYSKAGEAARLKEMKQSLRLLQSK